MVSFTAFFVLWVSSFYGMDRSLYAMRIAVHYDVYMMKLINI